MQLLLLVKVCRIKIITTDRHTHKKERECRYTTESKVCVCVCVVCGKKGPETRPLCGVPTKKSLDQMCDAMCTSDSSQFTRSFCGQNNTEFWRWENKN